MAIEAAPGRVREIGAIAGAVLELAQLTGTPTPPLQAIHAPAKVLDAAPARDCRAGAYFSHRRATCACRRGPLQHCPGRHQRRTALRRLAAC